MSGVPFCRDNHYTPCVYLRGFAGPGKRIFAYRTLVPRTEVPLWKPSSTRGVGYLSHLYTRIAAGQETDEIETWLKRDFEDPAAEPLRKAISGERLTTKDWTCLISFLAAQIVRTPAFFVKNVPRWQADAQPLLNSVVRESVQRLEAAKKSGHPLQPPQGVYSEYLPVRVAAQIEPGKEGATLKAAVVVGRGYWLFAMRRLLAGSAAKALHENQWSILAPYEGLSWFTSDAPVILLNYHADGKYDFNGGWGSHGSEILLPLGPGHLLYTHIGYRPPQRGMVLPRNQTESIRRFIAEHAYRMIFAASPENSVSGWRPRTVNDELFHQEQGQWRTWHVDQTGAEKGLMDTSRSL